jgi:hypothetical protein
MMDYTAIRRKLHKMGIKNLFEMVMSQKESRCIMYGLCSFYFKHRGYRFCLSEILGKGCELQKLEKPQEEVSQNNKEFHFSLPSPIISDKPKVML